MNNKERTRQKIAELETSLDELKAELKEEDAGILTGEVCVYERDDSPRGCGEWVFIPRRPSGCQGFSPRQTIYASFSKEPHVALPGRLIASGEYACPNNRMRMGHLSVDDWFRTWAEPGDTITITRDNGEDT